MMMTKLFKTFILLFPLILLTACSSPKISNIKGEIIENNPGNYQKVEKTEVYISTYHRPNGDILNQNFGSVNITYKDANGATITTETTNTIQEAIDQNKTGATLVTGDGRGTTITYDAEVGDKVEARTYNVPFIAEFNIKKIKTESDLEHEISKNSPKLSYTWEGTGKKVIETITLRYREEKSRSESYYNTNTKKIENHTVYYDLVTDYTYKYDNGN